MEVGPLNIDRDQLEEICEIAERAVRSYVLSKVSPQRIASLDVAVDVEKEDQLVVTIDVSLELSPLLKDYDVQNLVNEAVEHALSSVEERLRASKCGLKK